MTRYERTHHGACLGFCLTLAFIAFASVQVFGQVSGATLTGTVTDPTGAVIPKVQVSIKNVATGVTRVVPTNSVGLYTAPNLRPGPYAVTFSAHGFTTMRRTGITLTVGGAQQLNVALQVGSQMQTVQVSGAAPIVQLASSAVSNVVNSTTVRQLPLNGRSWTDLATLQPGVSNPKMQPDVGHKGQRGFGNQISISGRKVEDNNYRLDGISVLDYSNGAPSNTEGGALGVDAIQEFSVLTGTFPAQYGLATGGVVNAITRAGTNTFHGDAYEFLRNDALDAANFFQNFSNLPKPAFRRNQFGASIGGPIQKNKTFFFADYEGIRQAQGVTAVNTTPSAAARAGNLSSGPITVDPASLAFINAFYPLPNAGLVGKGDTGNFAISASERTTENYFTTRLDHTFSTKDSMFGTFMYDDNSFKSPDEFNNKVNEYAMGRKMIMLEETHIFSPQMVNSARFGFYRVPTAFGNSTPVNPAVASLAYSTTPGRFAPEVKVSGLTTFTGGVGALSIYNWHYNTFQWYDDVFYTHGAHSIKFGGSIERIQNNMNGITDGNGGFKYGSLASFLTNGSVSSFKGFEPSVSPLLGLSVRQSIFGLYLQDDWRARPNLTVNLGLRYEMATIPTENYGALSVLRAVDAPTPHLGSPYFESNPTIHNFEPRVGFSWDPFHNGKTAIRGGFGVYDELPLPYEFNLVQLFIAPHFIDGSASNLPAGSFPTGAYNYIVAHPSSLVSSFFDPNPKRNYILQYSFNIQQQLAPSLAVMLGYVGSGGVHDAFRDEDANTVIPTLTPQGYAWPLPLNSGTPINPTVGIIRGMFWAGSSRFNALEAQVTKSMSHGLQVMGNYTWSRGVDDGSAPLVGDTFANSQPGLIWFDTALNRGESDFQVNQNLEIDGVWNAPSPKAGPAVAQWLLGGWQLGGIFTASSGIPFTPIMGGDPLGQLNEQPFDVPNRAPGPGCGTPVNSGSVNSYLNLPCFAAPTALNIRGNLGRNSVWGPPQRDFDFSLVKNDYIKRISESFNVQFRAEFFNLFNLAEFQPPLSNQTLFDSKGRPVGGAGEITMTSEPEREIQFALKLIW
ncbi:MAG: TonB-dependent receptor [Terriglobia bacterium]